VKREEKKLQRMEKELYQKVNKTQIKGRENAMREEGKMEKKVGKRLRRRGRIIT
jgi:Skp family chaperone for outer membrane proteins